MSRASQSRRSSLNRTANAIANAGSRASNTTQRSAEQLYREITANPEYTMAFTPDELDNLSNSQYRNLLPQSNASSSSRAQSRSSGRTYSTTTPSYASARASAASSRAPSNASHMPSTVPPRSAMRTGRNNMQDRSGVSRQRVRFMDNDYQRLMSMDLGAELSSNSDDDSGSSHTIRFNQPR